MAIASGVVVQATTQNVNTVLAGPSGGGAAVPGFRVLVGSDLPTPTSSTLGGVQSFAALPSQWISGISVFGVCTSSQPSFSNILSAATNAQLPNGLSNANSALQSLTIVSGTAVYVTSSNINMPASPVNGIVVGSTIEWEVWLTKSAAGTGTWQMIIYTGTNGTTADTQSVLQTIGTQTAVADSMFVKVKITFTAVGASGSFFWSMATIHSGATATGFGGLSTGSLFTGTVSGFNTTSANLKFGIGFVGTTGTPVVTVPLVQVEAYNLA